MASAFSSQGAEVITRNPQISSLSSSSPSTSFTRVEDIQNVYEISETCQRIKSGNFKIVALQFPDDLLPDAVHVYQALQRDLNKTPPASSTSASVNDPSNDQSTSNIQLYVLADTTYGSCCVDEVAAQHVNADCVVHYGHACMSPTSRLPVIYIFRKKPINVESCAKVLIDIYKDQQQNIDESSSMHLQRPVSIMLDVAYQWNSDQIFSAIHKEMQSAEIAVEMKLEVREVATNDAQLRTRPSARCKACDCDRASSSTSHHENAEIQDMNCDGSQRPEGKERHDEDVIKEKEQRTILYIGGESTALTNIIMTNSWASVISYNPENDKGRVESLQTNKMLGRRYAYVEKARDADVFGLVVGTLGVSSYLSLIQHVRKLLQDHEKKVYTLAVGKLNPAKLANYTEIECFVLVACPETSLVEDPKSFYRPIVTPYEVEIALGRRQWGQGWKLGFGDLLDEGYLQDEDANATSENDEPQFSLSTGTYRQRRRFRRKGTSNADIASLSIATREDKLSVARLLNSAAGEHLAMRSYQGLEARIGRDKPAAMEEGRRGVARGYEGA